MTDNIEDGSHDCESIDQISKNLAHAASREFTLWAYKGEIVMPYFVMRLYSGSGDRSVDQTLSAVQSELFPKLKEAGGLIRYTTLAMDDSGIASTSVYENKEAAQRGVQVAADVVSEGAQFLQGYKLNRVLEGEIARRVDHNPQAHATYGVARIFKTTASAAEIADAMAQPPDVFSVPGRVRSFIVQLTDGRVGGFFSFDTKETADRVDQEIRRVRANNSTPMAKLTPDAPEILSGRIVSSTGT
jgi:hypothetical protein